MRGGGRGSASRDAARAPARRHHLPFRRPRALERQRRQRVGRNHALQDHDLLLLQGRQQGASPLPDQVHHGPDRRRPRRERRRDGRVARPDHLRAVRVVQAPQQLLGGRHRILRRLAAELLVVDVAQAPVDLPHLDLHLALHPQRDVLDGAGLGQEARLAPLLAPPDLLLEPLLLLRGHVLLGGVDAGLAPLPGVAVRVLERLLLGVQDRLRARVALGRGELGPGVRVPALAGGVRVAVPGEERQADVGLLQGAHVVAAVAAHEDGGRVVQRLQRPADPGLALGRHAREDVHAARDGPPHRLLVVRRGRGRAEGLLRDHQGPRAASAATSAAANATGAAPARPPRAAAAGLQHQGGATVGDVALARDVQRRQGRVARHHGHAVRGLRERRHHDPRVRARLALEGRQAAQLQVPLHVVPPLDVAVAAPRRQRQDAQPPLGEADVRGLEPRGRLPEERPDGLRRALDQRRRDAVDVGDHRHALERRREVEAPPGCAPPSGRPARSPPSGRRSSPARAPPSARWGRPRACVVVGADERVAGRRRRAGGLGGPRRRAAGRRPRARRRRPARAGPS